MTTSTQKSGPQLRVVSSYNGWDPLEEVIVGSALRAGRVGYEPAFNAYNISPERKLQTGHARPEAEIEAAQAQLDNLAKVLEREGVIVRRPSPINSVSQIRTPDFEVQVQGNSACPRDVLMVVGDHIIEAPMGLRARFFAYLPYRELVKEYFNSGARWSAAPKPSMSDALYVQDYSTLEKEFDADTHPSLTEFEPCFDAASFARIGKDIFYQPDVVTNDFGARWLSRLLGPEFRFHRCKFKDQHPQHIDATLVPLRPGLVMTNPERPATDDTLKLFKENGWEVVVAPSWTVEASTKSARVVSNWISMNVFNIDERTIVCEEQEDGMIKFFESFGFRVIAIPFRNVYSFGGSIHCCTVDVRRRGGLKSYFPRLDDHLG